LKKNLPAAGLFFCVLLGGCKERPQQPAISAGSVEVHYAPAENLEHLDVSLLGQAHSSIDMAAYSLTDFAIIDALLSAAQRGVHIRIYRDLTQNAGEAARARKTSKRKSDEDDEGEDATTSSVLNRLTASPNIEVRVKHSRTLMHLKSYAVDGTILRTGSANFSPTGEKRQDNDLVLIHDPTAALKFEADFKEVWNRPDNQSTLK
jgi:phosphatidylserine/phosphatidylglycerophosphate/cardiolipin synthase-like enzyme